jgi:hypothetical protein
MSPPINDHLVLVGGESACGKSASLMNLQNPERWMYLNCESGKRLPFKSRMKKYTITDPYQVYEAFDFAESQPDIEGICIDSITYLMDMFESVHVLPSTNTMKAWGQYAQFFKNLMQVKVARSSKNVIFTAHTLSELNEDTMSYQTKVPVKGSLKNQGVESYFSVVLSAKKLKLKDLEAYSSPLLTITEEEEMLGYKYVFQTRLTKATVNERIRGPLGMWTPAETFINNDVQLVMNRLHEYYNDEDAAA